METKQRKRDPQGVIAIDLGFALLDVVVEAGKALTPTEMLSATGMTQSRLDRFLTSFKNSGLLRHDEITDEYDLGPAAALLGIAAQHRIDEFRLVDDALFNLAHITGATASAVVWGNHGPTIIRRIEASRAVAVTTRVGSAIPITRTSSGIVFAAFLPSDVVNTRISIEIDSTYTTGLAKVQAEKRLVEQIESLRTTGVATIEGDFLPGVDAIAAPVFGPTGEVWVSLAVLGPRGSLDMSPTGPAKSAVLSVTRALSQRVGYGA